MNRILIHLVVVFAALSTAFVPANAGDNVELVISRSKHQLAVKKDGVNVRTFKVAFGSGGKKAKLRSGDHTTPKGKYRISKIRDSNRFHMFMQLNYPNMEDAKRAYKNHSISRKQYQAILDAHTFGNLPPQNTSLGGAIGIHGIGNETQDKVEIHQISDWTQGCIAMRNHEIEELNHYIDVGTPISIID
ncbi:MAG: L,D-transpeptidase [Gammaproteobacteria bacterium]|nr:MAG: L,D-transpeptidase [Gammaproteobacteria bacterium]RKZ92864.1 MAG: L,D-transpeptidase [Gammaproteobacteria bacterium]RKZ97588.1 MAG: L,D-transpeptidase [Gammaproteobacteria bacterium]